MSAWFRTAACRASLPGLPCSGDQVKARAFYELSSAAAPDFLLRGLEASAQNGIQGAAEDGGWATDYDEKGRPLGRAKVETSSLAVLALGAVAAAGSAASSGFGEGKHGHR